MKKFYEKAKQFLVMPELYFRNYTLTAEKISSRIIYDGSSRKLDSQG